MLQIWSNRRQTNCNGTSHRDFLKVGALGMGGLMLPDLLRFRAAAKAEGKPTKNTSVVWLWLGGGPTQVETFDPKMSAPVEFRSTVDAVKTCVPGVEFGGVFPKMAQCADKMAIVRSFAHTNSGHGGGTHWVMTGYNFPPADNGQAQVKPGLGSILARYRGANNSATGLPTYVRMSGILGDGPAWLGAAYAPFDVGGNARTNMNMKVTLENLADRRALLDGFDRIDRDLDRSGVMSGLDSFDQQAFDLIMSRARETFDLNKEDPRTRDRYGFMPAFDPKASNRCGAPAWSQRMLLARRLVEAGVRLVTVDLRWWDTHVKGFESLKLGFLPRFDQAYSALIDDLEQRGLLESTMVVAWGEFGRTPRVNNDAGRDHYPNVFSAALAGGPVQGGRVVGESDAKGAFPKTNPKTPQDVLATLYEHLGIDTQQQYLNATGRPITVLPEGKAIEELF